ncbi:hypothetical protein M569_04496, partial [Genlisea aurea]
MGNAVCFRPMPSATKLISYGGGTRIITGQHVAGELMSQSPCGVVCHADSFFLGRPIPALDAGDELLAGETYFLFPFDCFERKIFSASTLAKLASSCPRAGTIRLQDCPFVYAKDVEGRVSIKIGSEFIAKLITGDSDGDKISRGGRLLCSTPELQRDYDSLIGSRNMIWSPKLETISENKIR